MNQIPKWVIAFSVLLIGISLLLGEIRQRYKYIYHGAYFQYDYRYDSWTGKFVKFETPSFAADIQELK